MGRLYTVMSLALATFIIFAACARQRLATPEIPEQRQLSTVKQEAKEGWEE